MKNFVTLKKILLGFALAMTVAFTAGAQKIAIVDVSAILNNMDEYKRAQTQLDDLAAKWRREIAEEYDEIKGMYNKYQAEQVLLSDEVRRQREEEIMNKETSVRDLQKSKFGPEGALFKKRQDLVQPIQERVFGAIENYADSKGYDFIFDKGSSSGMIFSSAKYDKTDDIKAELGL